jgi:hypothetical protein
MVALMLHLIFYCPNLYVLTKTRKIMGRARVITCFVHHTEANLYDCATEMYQYLNGNPRFNIADGLLTRLASCISTYSNARMKADNRGKLEVFAKNVAKEELQGVMSEIARHVNLWAKGDSVLLASSGIPLCKEGKRHQELAAPGLVKLSSGITHGEVVVDVPANKNTRVYSIYYATMPAPADVRLWCNILSTKHKITIGGLQPASQQAFRAGYLGTSGKVHLSEVFTILVQ